jgi:tetratricopeptide (TPR) repeat protein
MDEETNKKFLQDKIDQLNKQAWEIRVNDSTQAHKLSKEAIDLAERINYAKGKAEGYRTFGFTLIRFSRHHEALEYSKKALVLFESFNDLQGQTSIYHYYGIIERSLGNYAASLEFLFKSLELAKQTGCKESLSLSHYHLGVTYRYLGNLEQALEYFLQSLSIAQEINYWISSSYSLNNIGSIYFELSDYGNALGYYQQSLTSRQQAGDKWGEAGCLDNIGIIHFKLKDNNKALEFCSQALSISQAIADKKGQSNALFHLGNIYQELADYNNAIECCSNSLTIRRDIEDKKGEAEILLFLAELYLNENFINQPPAKTFELLNKALPLGEEIKALDILSKIHNGFYKAYKQLNRYREALNHLESFNSIEKEIHSNSFNQKIVNLEITHKAEQLKKEAEIYRLRNKHLENELQLQKLENEKKQQELQRKAIELEMQALRAQMNPHFIFNCLSSINGFILKNESEPASDYLTKFSRLIRMVLTNSKKTFITLENELEMLRLYLEMERLRFQYSFDFNISFKNEIDPENIFIPPLLLQPFAENAIWHGLMHKQGEGHLQISLSLEEKILTCMITDNGIGRIKAAMIKSKSAEKQKSMGLQITANRLALLNRDIDEQTFFNIEDITDDKGNAAGTRVILKMHYRDMTETIA